MNAARRALAVLHGRMVASDPARSRIRLALRAATALLLGLASMAALALPAGQPVTVVMLAAVVAMLSSTGLNDPTTRQRVVTTALVPVVAVAAVALATVTGAKPLLADVVFVVVMGTAAWVRRYGPRGTALGFVGFMGFFFALFLRATPGQLPWLALACLLGAASMAVVRFAIFPDRPGPDLRRSVRAFHGRTAATCMALEAWLADPSGRDVHRTLTRAVADLNQVALLIEQQLEDEAVVEPLTDPEVLRGRVFDAELTVEHLVATVRAEARELDPVEVTRIRKGASALAARALGHRPTAPTVRLALSWHPGGAPARAPGTRADLGDRLLRLAGQLDDLAATRIDSHPGRPRDDPGRDPAGQNGGGGGRDGGGRDEDGRDEDGRDEDGRRGKDGDEDRDGGDSGSEDDRDGSDAAYGGERLSQTTRVAIQVTVAGALAIGLGHLLSAQRWYWAVIAAFVVFSNAPTRVATARRAAARVAGTALGIVAGLLVGRLLAGDTRVELVLIIVLVFVAFWAFQVSQVATIFCFTIMLALLYSLLGMLTSAILVLRLEETLLGAFIGGTVATLLVPATGRGAIDGRATDLLERTGSLLDGIAAGDGPDRARTAVRELDRSFQQLRDAVRPTVAGVPGALPRSRRQRMLQFSGLHYWARALAVSAAEPGDAPVPGEQLQQVCRNLSALKDWIGDGEGPPVQPLGLEDEPDHDHPGRAALARLDQTVVAIAQGIGARVAPLPREQVR